MLLKVMVLKIIIIFNRRVYKKAFEDCIGILNLPSQEWTGLYEHVHIDTE